MQAWGTQDRFGHRFTELEPSKSGVIGLLCAALGRSREAEVDDLAALRYGVRVDREGKMARDFHTAGGGPLPTARPGERQDYGVVKATGGRGDTAVSHRHYLADADFLVGLEGPEELLGEVEQALRRPRWPLFLGRKSFVPGWPVWLPQGGLRGAPLEEALRAEPALVSVPEVRHVRAVLECGPGLGDAVRMDQPYGAAFAARQFGPRDVRTEFWELAPAKRPSLEVQDASVAP